jgi:formylglycine-generating enzyme required for sulfatase activity
VTATNTGVFMGTPDYASPEQAMGLRGNELDPRTDLYSLGLVMFEMLTGVKPFAGDTLVAALLSRLQNEPVAPQTLRPEIPKIVSDLVVKAIAKEKEARYGSAEEMRRAIEGALDQLSGARPVDTPSSVVSEPAAKQEKRKFARGLVAGLVAAAGAVALAGWLLWPRPNHPNSAPEPLKPPLVTPQPRAVDEVPKRVPPPSIAEKPKSEVLDRKKRDAPRTTATAAVPEPAKPASEVAKSQATTGEVKVNSKDGLKYIWIAPGKFMMGCSPGDAECGTDENPTHEVTLSKGFWIGETEVTQAAYERVTGRNPSSSQGPDLPVESVSWFQANAYCKESGMRLPSEAEWEYAARGGGSGPRPGRLNELVWWVGNSGEKTHEVAQKRPNGYGLYDVLGNVAEWTADWYAQYPTEAATDPHGPVEGEYRVARGGSSRGAPKFVRVSTRLTRKPGVRGYIIGFRCAGD